MDRISILKRLDSIASELESHQMYKEAQLVDKMFDEAMYNFASNIKLAARGVAVYDENSGVPYEVYEKNEAYAQLIAKELESYSAQAEQSRWAEEDDDFHSEHDDHNPAEQLRNRQRRNSEEFLLQELHRVGARLERPYEHWNEEESYRAWQERDRDYERD